MRPSPRRQPLAELLVFARQVRGELRKQVHPLVGLTSLCVGIATSALQAAHLSDPYPGPSIRDVAGELRIAFLQHSTTLGFVYAGVLAAVGTADEAGRGALADVLLREPRRRRVTLMKSAAVYLGLLGSVVLTFVGLAVTHGVLAAQGVTAPPMSRSSLSDMAIDVGCSLPVLALAATTSAAIALATRSILATIVLTITVFYLPLTVLQDEIFWATPTRWIVEWLHLDPFGEGVDYLADNSPYDHRGVPAFVGGCLIVMLVVVLAGAMPAIISRSVQRANQRHV